MFTSLLGVMELNKHRIVRQYKFHYINKFKLD